MMLTLSLSLHVDVAKCIGVLKEGKSHQLLLLLYRYVTVKGVSSWRHHSTTCSTVDREGVAVCRWCAW